MSSEKDQARLIAERVARRLSGGEKRQPQTETAANNEKVAADAPRARIINFISSGPPVRSVASAQHPPVAKSAAPVQSPASSTEFFQFVPVAQSPWLGRLPSMLANANPHTVDHPSQQRFGVEETTVAELVEFFESEKKCAMDPTGKPCDHCAMCSSRGF